ncbi:hypothetical protein SAY87_014769 [Trapa incisa]|uniref:Non-specific lipid-transfer protein n=1 Tax=Trapa incisa TaxID=236973 RepID=A0AAN7GNS6_9MYRT|nr:hypothetical protein SAY87_014769 [Trapa incisa]
MAFTPIILKLASCLLVVYMIVVSQKAVTALTCQKVALLFAPCIFSAINHSHPIQAPVPVLCCNGFKTITKSAQTTFDRQTVCNCLKAFSGNVTGINYGVVASLPSRCGVNIPYKISPSTNCNSVK